MKKLGLGVLGLGEGRSIISAALNSEFWNVVQLCDLNEQLGQRTLPRIQPQQLHDFDG